jgi:hypothetical protein
MSLPLFMLLPQYRKHNQDDHLEVLLRPYRRRCDENGKGWAWVRR